MDLSNNVCSAHQRQLISGVRVFNKKNQMFRMFECYRRYILKCILNEIFDNFLIVSSEKALETERTPFTVCQYLS